MNTEFERGLDVLDQRASMARIAIFAVIASSSVTIVALSLLLNGVVWPVDNYSDELHPVDLIILLDVLVLLISTIFVGMWIHRAHKNLYAIDLPNLEYSPGMSVGWFFIPIANLFKPFQAMRELWNASHGAVGRYDDAAPGLFWVWWLSYVFSGVGSGFSEDYSPLDLVGYGLTIASAVTLLHIVNTITRAQRSLNLADTFI